jgi:hypothetical protein
MVRHPEKVMKKPNRPPKQEQAAYDPRIGTLVDADRDSGKLRTHEADERRLAKLAENCSEMT